MMITVRSLFLLVVVVAPLILSWCGCVVVVHAAFLSPTATTKTTRAFSSLRQQQRLSSSLSVLHAKGSNKLAVIAGATGYIGKSVVRESVRQDYKTIALVRDIEKVQQQNKQLFEEYFDGAQLVECDVTDAKQVKETMAQITDNNNNKPIDAIVSCLASRSGVKKDAYLIDYQATLNCLEAGRDCNAKHFVLLSAFCVKNPWLQFQQAKLKFEKALTEDQTDMSYTIVRPTAFFKSVSGQLEVVQSGAPFVMFGDGEVTRCNPIAESELAQYLIDSITDPTRKNKIINLGGPDEPLTMKKQGEMLFTAVNKEPKFIYAPLWLFDAIINTLQFFADITKSEMFEDAAETGRIGKYYAVEDMLTTLPEEKFGTITLQQHYNRIAIEGQEYDPYTTMFARAQNVDAKSMREGQKEQEQEQQQEAVSSSSKS